MKVSIDGTIYRSAPHSDEATTCDNCDIFAITHPGGIPQCMLPKYRRASDYCESCATKGRPIIFKRT